MNKRSGTVISGFLIAVAVLLLIRTLNASSRDFITWTQQDSVSLDDIPTVTRGGGQYVAVGENGRIATSPDGITWTHRFSGTSDDLKDVAWNGRLYVAAGGNTIISSADGVTWTFRRDAGGGSLKSLAWGDGLFVAVGKRHGNLMGLTMISGDGIIWASYNEPSSVPLGVDWAGLHFYRMHEDFIERSPDGLAWEIVLSRPNSDFRNVRLAGASFVAVGEGVSCASADGSSWSCTKLSRGALTAIIFHDGFESGNTSAWSRVIPPSPTPAPTTTPPSPTAPPPTQPPPTQPPPTQPPPTPGR